MPKGLGGTGVFLDAWAAGPGATTRPGRSWLATADHDSTGCAAARAAPSSSARP